MVVTASDLLFGENNEKPLFSERSQIKSWIQNKLLPLGILIVIERSDDTKIVFKCKSYRYSSAFKKIRQKRVSKKKKLLLQKQGLLQAVEMEQKLNQERFKSSSCSCPFRIRANYSIRLDKWSIVIVNGHHNHPLKNSQSSMGASFNEASFKKDISESFAKNRILVNPCEPEMVADFVIDSPKRGTKTSSSSSSPTNFLSENCNMKEEEIDDLSLSSISSTNSMDDFLDAPSTSATQSNDPVEIALDANSSSSYELQNFHFGNHPEKHDSPFFDPVQENEAQSTSSWVDNFFNSAPSAIVNPNKTDSKLEDDVLNLSDTPIGEALKSSDLGFNGESSLSNFSCVDDHTNEPGFLLPQQSIIGQPFLTNYDDQLNQLMDQSSARPNDDYTNIPITTFFGDCQALY